MGWLPGRSRDGRSGTWAAEAHGRKIVSRLNSGMTRLVSTPLWNFKAFLCPLWMTISKAALSLTRVMWYVDDAYAGDGHA